MKRLAIFLVIWIPRLTPFFTWLSQQVQTKNYSQSKKRSSTKSDIHTFLWDMIMLYNTEREIRAAGWTRQEDQYPFWSPDSHWDEHRLFSVDAWREEVANNETRQSYVEWVNSQLKTEDVCRK